jgi:hypothetical protein
MRRQFFLRHHWQAGQFRTEIGVVVLPPGVGQFQGWLLAGGAALSVRLAAAFEPDQVRLGRGWRWTAIGSVRHRSCVLGYRRLGGFLPLAEYGIRCSLAVIHVWQVRLAEPSWGCLCGNSVTANGVPIVLYSLGSRAAEVPWPGVRGGMSRANRNWAVSHGR